MFAFQWRRVEITFYNNWPKGGAVVSLRKCKLWTGIAHAPLDVQTRNLYTRMRLLMPNNFDALTFDLWPSEIPIFSIIWKTVKNYLLLGIFNFHINFNFHMKFGPISIECSVPILFKLKHSFLIIQWTLWFYANYSSASKSYIEKSHVHDIWQICRGLVHISLKLILFQFAKWGRYCKRLKIQTLNGHKSCLALAKDMQLSYTRALTQEEHICVFVK